MCERRSSYAERVSFDRPHPLDGAGKLVVWDQFWASWLAAEGIAFDCCSQWDVACGRQPLDGYRCMLRTGHDEYWAAEEAAAVQGFVDEGGNLAFFSGNNCHWQVRYGDGGRTITCYRHPYLKKRPQAMGVSLESLVDPVAAAEPERATTLWARLPGEAGRVRQRLTGNSWTGMVNVPFEETPEWPDAPVSAGWLLGPEGGDACWTVRRPEHWVFEGTGLAEGESFGLRETIVGTEADGCDTELVYDATLGRKVLVPSGKDGVDPTQWLILASCLAAGLGETTGPVGPPNTLHTATLVYHEGEPGGGGDIFNCATLDWAHGLRTSEETATITRNVLRRFVA